MLVKVWLFKSRFLVTTQQSNHTGVERFRKYYNYFFCPRYWLMDPILFLIFLYQISPSCKTQILLEMTAFTRCISTLENCICFYITMNRIKQVLYTKTVTDLGWGMSKPRAPHPEGKIKKLQ